MESRSDLHIIVSWSLYDWGNSAFATTVMAGFFPVFFKEYWSHGSDVTVSTLQLGAANSFASVVVALLAPLLGAIADQGGVKRRFLLLFAMMGVIMTGSLYFVVQGDWKLAAALYVLAAIGFSGANVFYDALLVNVAGEKKVDIVSAVGYSFGYLGGGLLFALNIAMTLQPHRFGLTGTAEAVRLSFVTVAAWWAAFTIPLLLFVKEPRAELSERLGGLLGSGLSQLTRTFREIRKLRVVFLFLIGYWLYIDGVDTIIRMAVDYGLSLGFSSRSLLTALLITQFVGFPAAIVFGRLGERLGPKTGIFIGLGVYLAVTVWGYFMDHEAEFYGLAIAIGTVQGGVQALSRSLFTRLIPRNKAAEFFGFYNMLGKFAAVIGPALMGLVSFVTGNPRWSVVAVGGLFIAGGVITYLVDVEEGKRLAASLERS
jgi:UMF1 family MFS transporter